MKKYIGIFFLITGLSIIGLWIMLFITNQIPELQTNKVEILFHITIELIMAIFSIYTGFTIIKKHTFYKQMTMFTSGMLIYSIINSSGYYLNLINYPMLILFAIILVLVILSDYIILKTN